MAQNNGPVKREIINSWTLIAFAKLHGKMQVAPFTNDAGDDFKTCVFTDPNNPDNQTNKTFVPFSSNLGELTPQEIARMKDQLQVVQLDSGNYSLCKQGNSTWEDVDLGI